MQGEIVTGRSKAAFRRKLLGWYDANRRELPWRNTRNPYHIWVSEIMLQQTRVAAVIDHYHHFLARFPTLETLARAREQSVLAAWSGLGYYRRARNLHASAKTVISKFGGHVPRTPEELRELPGIGRYTAAAIASIAFSQPTAVVDGNVERVLVRVTGQELRNSEIWEIAQSIISVERPGDFNQAMMEFGATVCVPGQPQCKRCPVLRFCATRGNHSRPPGEARVVKPFNVGLLASSDGVWLTQRHRSLKLMPGMWELPEIVPNGENSVARFKHAIMNTDYAVSVFPLATEPANGQWIQKSRLRRLPLSGLTRKILRHFALL